MGLPQRSVPRCSTTPSISRGSRPNLGAAPRRARARGMGAARRGRPPSSQRRSAAYRAVPSMIASHFDPSAGVSESRSVVQGRGAEPLGDRARRGAKGSPWSAAQASPSPARQRSCAARSQARAPETRRSRRTPPSCRRRAGPATTWRSCRSAWSPRRHARRLGIGDDGQLALPVRPRLRVRHQLAHEVRNVGHVRAAGREEAVHEALVQRVLRDLALQERVRSDHRPLNEGVTWVRSSREGSPPLAGCPWLAEARRKASREAPSRTSSGACRDRLGD